MISSRHVLSANFHVGMLSIRVSWLEFAALVRGLLSVTLIHIGISIYLIHVTMLLDMQLHVLHFDMYVALTYLFALLMMSHLIDH